ncbi:DUF4332 domain-containing protein [Cyanobacterium sp. Dongsha4]|uniref:DUF4332 domain-containing protein n=1 Tax=Cyanobacterium sp. DS4 TaxID=2878255 RepID=UPI002E7FE876|nr:DUF4332 domain-containing protein [Cyanobacterium sp. Dongsha4]WVK99905.1 DUF4332 domain-containing protein [Cyanobacterium sp. Dongsha4]
MSIAISDLPGMQKTDIDRLQNLGITNIEQLLVMGKNKQDRELLAQKIGVSSRYVHKWFALADLAHLPSVGVEYCGLILHSGIISVAQLSQCNAPQLQKQILKLQVANLHRRDLCPSFSLIQSWIQEAKQDKDSNRFKA